MSSPYEEMKERAEKAEVSYKLVCESFESAFASGLPYSQKSGYEYGYRARDKEVAELRAKIKSHEAVVDGWVHLNELMNKYIYELETRVLDLKKQRDNLLEELDEPYSGAYDSPKKLKNLYKFRVSKV